MEPTDDIILPLLKKKKFGNYTVDVYGTIAKTYYSEGDVLCVLRDYGVKPHFIHNLRDGQKEKLRVKTDHGSRYVNLLTSNGIRVLLTRATKAIPVEYYKKFGVDQDEVRLKQKEQGVMGKFCAVFKCEKTISLFKVDGESIDLYFPEYNIAVDFIEGEVIGHEAKVRKIVSELNCKYVTVDTTQSSFDIYVAMGDLNQTINHAKKFPVKRVISDDLPQWKPALSRVGVEVHPDMHVVNVTKLGTELKTEDR